jgi:hypothetical protein
VKELASLRLLLGPRLLRLVLERVPERVLERQLQVQQLVGLTLVGLQLVQRGHQVHRVPC